MHLQSRFYEKAPLEFRARIKKEYLEIIYQKVSITRQHMSTILYETEGFCRGFL